MKIFVLALTVMLMVAAGCQSVPAQPAVPAAATPTSAVTPEPDAHSMPTRSIAATSTLASISPPETKPIKPTTSIAATPTLPAMPGPNVKPAIDANYQDPANEWCPSESHDFGDFYCQNGEYHLVAKGGNIATSNSGDFKNFILQAQMRLSITQGVYLGVGYELLTPEIAAHEHITGTRGALIGGLVTGGPAETAGLTPGDVITAINGNSVDENHDLRSQMFKFKPNEKVTLTVVKGTANGPADQHDVKVKLVERPAEQTQGAYGVVFRGNGDQGRFYIFQLHPDGEYQLMTWSPESSQTLIPWTASPAIKHGGALNLLQVIAQDKNLTLFVNDQQLASVQDDTRQNGVAGPVALEDGHAIVSLFKVWELP